MEKCITLPVKGTGPLAPLTDSLEHPVHSEFKVKAASLAKGSALRAAHPPGSICVKTKFRYPSAGAGGTHRPGLTVLCCGRVSEHSALRSVDTGPILSLFGQVLAPSPEVASHPLPFASDLQGVTSWGLHVLLKASADSLVLSEHVQVPFQPGHGGTPAPGPSAH